MCSCAPVHVCTCILPEIDYQVTVVTVVDLYQKIHLHNTPANIRQEPKLERQNRIIQNAGKQDGVSECDNIAVSHDFQESLFDYHEETMNWLKS